MIADSHIHTSFSTDSAAPMEEMVKKAADLGMKSICLTDHYDMDYPTGEFQLDTEAYLKEAERLRQEYQDRIDIRIGVELGLQPSLGDRLRDYIRQYPFDFIIGSVHLIHGEDPFYRDRFVMTDEELYREYFRCTLECLRNTSGYQTLGHLDYVVRYGTEKGRGYAYENYARIIDDILKELIRKKIALEVNTAGFKAGLGRPNPDQKVLQRYRSLGGEMVTAGSDAHSPEYVGSHFSELPDFLKEAGFRSLTLFRGKKPEQIDLQNI